VSRRVCFLSEAFLPNDGSTSGMLIDLAAELAGVGLDVRALARGSGPRTSRVRGVRVRRVRSTRSDRGSLFATVAGKLTFAVSSFLAALREPAGATLVAVTSPPFNVWVALAAGFLRRRTCVLLMHDLYPDVVVKLGLLGRYSPVAWLWRALNRVSFARAARIVVIGRDMERIIRGKLPPRMRDKCIFIPCWANGETIRRGAAGSSAGSRPGRLIVHYGGNIGLAHEIDTVLGAARILEGEPLDFVFRGSGRQAHKIERSAAARPNVRLLPRQPEDVFARTLASCDVGLVTLRAGFEGLAVPSRLYGIMAAGKPVVAVVPEGSEVARVVRGARCGVVVRPGDAGGLAAALRDLRENAARRRDLGEAAREAFEASYDLKVVARRWMEMLGGLPD